ncbi:Ribose import binding protein RbsB [wastewater metagenome]|uniref:Ribose import binding protein RbsB n=2 Tax=unclassified sequences TaxID=12908 RepID=A0A5B8RCD2_9ZZZZ|nr:ribose import binding protein RbsB [uncultured organism]
MKKRSFLRRFAGLALVGVFGLGIGASAAAQSKEIVYLAPGLDLPFWRYVLQGVKSVADQNGYDFRVLDSRNRAQTQLKNAQDAIARGADGIVLSPTDSSTAPSVLKLAKEHDVPVVIADIGTDEGDYASFIISDNYQGAKGVGEELAAALKERGWGDGSIGIVAISQARQNGRARTKGFRDGLKAGGIDIKEAGMRQMQSYTAEETFRFVQDMLTSNPDMHGLFVQTDRPTIGALRALKAARRSDDVLVAAFDGVPEFIDYIKSGEIVVSGMQQPFLMGQRSAEAMVKKLEGNGTPEKKITVPIQVVTSGNIDKLLPTIKKTVFANELE